MSHEQVFLLDVVVGREDQHHCFGVMRMNPVRREQDAGGRSSCFRLEEDPEAWSSLEFVGHVGGMVLQGDDDRSFRWHQPSRSVHRLAQEGARIEERNVLLWTLVTTDLPDKRT